MVGSVDRWSWKRGGVYLLFFFFGARIFSPFERVGGDAGYAQNSISHQTKTPTSHQFGMWEITYNLWLGGFGWLGETSCEDCCLGHLGLIFWRLWLRDGEDCIKLQVKFLKRLVEWKSPTKSLDPNGLNCLYSPYLLGVWFSMATSGDKGRDVANTRASVAWKTRHSSASNLHPEYVCIHICIYIYICRYPSKIATLNFWLWIVLSCGFEGCSWIPTAFYSIRCCEVPTLVHITQLCQDLFLCEACCPLAPGCSGVGSWQSPS